MNQKTWWESLGHSINLSGLPRWLSGKESACQRGRYAFDPWVENYPWRRKWQPTPVFLPGESHGWRSLVGYSPWNCKELDTTEWLMLSLFFFFHLLCVLPGPFFSCVSRDPIGLASILSFSNLPMQMYSELPSSLFSLLSFILYDNRNPSSWMKSSP